MQIVQEAHPSEEWYFKIRAIDQEGNILERTDQFTGAPQGFEENIEHGIQFPKSKLWREVLQLDDIDNQGHVLSNHEELLMLKLYLRRNGRWYPMSIPQTGSCLFSTIRRGLNLPKQYTNQCLRRELAIFCTKHADLLLKQHLGSLYTNYGEQFQKTEGQEQFPHAGPYSIKSHLLELMKENTWGMRSALTWCPGCGI